MFLLNDKKLKNDKGTSFVYYLSEPNLSKKNVKFKTICILLLTLCFPVFGQINIRFQAQHVFPIKTPDGKNVTQINSVCITPLRDVYLTESSGHRVIRLNTDGEVLGLFGGLGWSGETLDYPTGITTHDGLNLYVADMNNQRIIRLNRRLEWVTSIGGNNSDYSGQKTAHAVSYPLSLTQSKQGDLFFISQSSQLVYKVNSVTGAISELNSFTSGGGYLEEPGQIVIGKKNLFIKDRTGVKVFDVFGNYIRTINDDFFSGNLIIAADERDRVLIWDADKKALSLWTADGERLALSMAFAFEKLTAMTCFSRSLWIVDESPVSGESKLYQIEITEESR